MDNVNLETILEIIEEMLECEGLEKRKISTQKMKEKSKETSLHTTSYGGFIVKGWDGNFFSITVDNEERKNF